WYVPCKYFVWNSTVSLKKSVYCTFISEKACDDYFIYEYYNIDENKRDIQLWSAMDSFCIIINWKHFCFLRHEMFFSIHVPPKGLKLGISPPFSLCAFLACRFIFSSSSNFILQVLHVKVPSVFFRFSGHFIYILEIETLH